MPDRPRRVILIDDDNIDRYILKRSLMVLGAACTFDEFTNPVEAVEFLSRLEPGSRFTPSLIVTDMQLPDMDGYEVIKAIRELPLFENTPIVAITCYSPPFEAPMAILTGANYFFLKPLSGEKIRKIASVITAHQLYS